MSKYTRDAEAIWAGEAKAVKTNETSGLIVVERHHDGLRTIWSELDEEYFLKTVAAVVESDSSDSPCEYDTTTFEGACDYLAHDLQSFQIKRSFDEVDGFEELEHALYLGWIVAEYPEEE